MITRRDAVEKVAHSGKIRNRINIVLAGLTGILLSIVSNEFELSVAGVYALMIAVSFVLVPALLFFRFVWRNDDMPWKERGLESAG